MDGKRTEKRVDTALAIDVKLLQKGSSRTIFKSVGHAQDVSLNGMRLRIVGEAPKVAPHEVTALLMVHIAPRRQVEITSDVRWIRSEGDEVVLGLSHASGNPAAKQEVLQWANTHHLSATGGGWRRFAIAAVVLLLAVQTIRFFFTPGSPENSAITEQGGTRTSRPQTSAENEDENETSVVHSRRAGSTATTALLAGPSLAPTYEKLPLSKLMKEKLESHRAQPREEVWAVPAEKRMQRDFERNIQGMSEFKRNTWNIRVQGIECRQTSCLATIHSNGPSAWRAFMELDVYSQGAIDPMTFPFGMKCTPFPIEQPPVRNMSDTIENYETQIHFDCSKPLYPPLPDPPDISKDRLLNPELRAQLPESQKKNLDEQIARAQKKYQDQIDAIEREKKLRSDPNFLRVEP